MTESTKPPDKEFSYYKILEFLDKAAESKQVDETDLTHFKEIIRDNKYVSTYIRAIKEQMKEIKNIDDFIRQLDKENNSKGFTDYTPYEIKQILNCHFGNNYENDPIKIIHNIIFNAMEREGKICDFRDSINPETTIGRCEAEEHIETVEDDMLNNLSDQDRQIFDKINEEEGWDEAVEKFEDKLNPPNQELSLTLYQDDDTHKFDDSMTCYVCKRCGDYLRENGDCEVSCDME